MSDILVIPILTILAISLILLYSFSRLPKADQINTKTTPEEDSVKPVVETLSEKSRAEEPKAVAKKKIAKKVVRKRKRR